ncbi:hypothetical protein F7725_001456 [Dissostichus mawsoni]|uniref:Uncharacterized protein n=1 Tax=Dissostichus mawsoni TaxID=36200 RepID=A0A7J5ZJG1_DISMA|nr:hypothetical protein F7725_001456 [Dissostichus mawsoni]
MELQLLCVKPPDASSHGAAAALCETTGCLHMDLQLLCRLYGNNLRHHNAAAAVLHLWFYTQTRENISCSTSQLFYICGSTLRPERTSAVLHHSCSTSVVLHSDLREHQLFYITAVLHLWFYTQTRENISCSTSQLFYICGSLLRPERTSALFYICGSTLRPERTSAVLHHSCSTSVVLYSDLREHQLFYITAVLHLWFYTQNVENISCSTSQLFYICGSTLRPERTSAVLHHSCSTYVVLYSDLREHQLCSTSVVLYSDLREHQLFYITAVLHLWFYTQKVENISCSISQLFYICGSTLRPERTSAVLHHSCSTSVVLHSDLREHQLFYITAVLHLPERTSAVVHHSCSTSVVLHSDLREHQLFYITAVLHLWFYTQNVENISCSTSQLFYICDLREHQLFYITAVLHLWFYTQNVENISCSTSQLFYICGSTLRPERTSAVLHHSCSTYVVLYSDLREHQLFYITAVLHLWFYTQKVETSAVLYHSCSTSVVLHSDLREHQLFYITAVLHLPERTSAVVHHSCSKSVVLYSDLREHQLFYITAVLHLRPKRTTAVLFHITAVLHHSCGSLRSEERTTAVLHGNMLLWRG